MLAILVSSSLCLLATALGSCTPDLLVAVSPLSLLPLSHMVRFSLWGQVHSGPFQMPLSMLSLFSMINLLHPYLGAVMPSIHYSFTAITYFYYRWVFEFYF